MDVELARTTVSLGQRGPNAEMLNLHVVYPSLEGATKYKSGYFTCLHVRR